MPPATDLARAREIEQNPVADAWTAKDEENIAFLNEDQQALADVYDSLVASGILHEADADRETVINASGAGDDVAAAWKRGVILNRIAGYGLQFQRGEYENLDELRANILAAQKELEALRGNASDALGIYGAIEQLPRMIGYDAQYAGAGALVGGTIGSAVPGIGTLAGAGVGGAMGMAYTAANSEQGSFAADLLVQKDDAGNYLDPAAVQKAASLYGLLSGAVEVGGDALMFKLFKPVGGTIREAFSRRAARDAIREAAANRSLWPALRAFAGGAGKAAAVEGAQEFAQEGISTQIEATAKNLLSDAGANYYREQQAGAFSREGLSRMLEAGMAAAKTGPWFYAIPGGIRLTLDTRSALRAREFAEAHKELADKVAATRTRELSPARMESYLQTAGLDGDVLIPADAAWELQRKGTDLAGPLGWDVRDMEESAALGHDLVMPAARLQALLPPEQMKAVADIMRESPHAKSALEAANLNEDLPADMDGLIEQAEDDALERSAIEGELERLRGEMTQAVASAPHLVGQIASGADAETSVGRYVDGHLGLIVRRARDISRMGIPMSDTLSRVSLQGLLKDEQGRTVTPEEADALAGRNAEEEALAPFWDAVWGRLNPDSLRVDFPDARRELAYRHGRGLFAGKGEGLSVDALAEELKTRGLLDADADSSKLVEKLKEMERPRRKAGTIQDSTLFASIQDLQDPSIEWKQGFHNIPARPVVIPATGIGAKNANARAKETYGGKSFPLADGTEIRVGSDGIDETTTKRASSESLEALSALPEILANTHIYRQENATDAAALTKHGIAAAIIGGRPVLVRSVFKYIRQGKGGFWKYYGSKSMKLNIAKGAPASWVTKDSLRESETPFLNAPLSDSLYDWILAVKDNGKRFPEDRNILYHARRTGISEEENISNGLSAVNRLITEKSGVAAQAMYRNGIGYISFLWGFPGTSEKDFHDGYGISHIIAARNAQGADGEAIARKLVEVIAKGNIFTDKRGNRENKVTISHDGYVAILDMREKEGQKTWLLTGYKKASSGGKQAVNAQQATQLHQIEFSDAVGAEDVLGNIPHNAPELKELAHAMKAQALGSTTFDASGNYVIRLFRGANLSTLTHETAHVFFLEMERLEREGLADERMLADLAALRDWTAAMDDDAALKAEYDRYQKHAAYGGAEFDALPDYLKEDARSRAKQEMLARGFEQYLREGKAPSPQLEGVFARFRKWLMRVYRDALDLHVELSDEVRDVFDRMIAHEEEMELRAEADSSPLIQRPKGMRERQTVFQTEEKNAAGVPLSRVTRIEGTVTREELDAALSSLAGQDLPNLIEGVTAQVNANQKRKLESAKAREKSVSNGFDFGEHNGVAAQIANAWKWAAEARRTGDEKNNMPDVGIRRYVSALELNEKDAFAWLTVKETPTGLRIYSVELMDEEKLRGSLGNGIAEATTTAPSGRSFEEIIERLAKPVNEQKQSFLQTGNDEAPLVREGMTRKPDSAAAKVVSIPGNAVPEFSGMKDFADWLKDMLAEGGNVLIKSTGQEARFSSGNVKASVKRSRSREHRNAYAGLREMVENAEYDHYEKPDERHPDRGGQDVYYSALEMSGKLYSVKLKLDVVTEEQKASERGKGIFAGEDIRYKDHKLTEIEIAPAQDRGFTQMGKAAHGTDAISKVSLGVLRGSVKPSGIDGGTLFQGISDEVRDMFDRMLAHEEEMELRAEADSSPLIQRPKGMRERQTVFQTEEKNAAGVPLSRVTRIEGTVTREELDAALSSLAGQDLPNLIEGVTAQVNANQKRKLESAKAREKSVSNGFDFGEHNGVAAQIANAWKWAAEARRTGDEKNNMPDVGIRRYVSALELNEKDAFAWLTVKETPTGLRIYSVELMDEEKLRGSLGNGIAEATTTAPSGRSFEEIIERLAKPVNEQKQSFLQTGNDEAPLVREGMTRKPDSAAARVVTVEGNIVPDFEGGKGKHKTRKLVEWLYSYFDAPVDVTIASTSQKVRINKSGLEASVKKEKKPGHREAYGPLKELIEKAEYDRFEPADERHRSRVQGQDVYHSALRLGEQLYSVQLKFDIPNAAEVESRKRVGEKSIEDSRYKDHELREIEIAPAEVDGAFTRPSADAISKVSLGVLRGSVKPSGIDGGTLFQGISDEVRDMFDRMLAHEEEMELRAEAADVREETARLLDALELKGARRQEIEGLITAAKDEAAERLRRARDADRLEQRRAWTREAREQMEREQVYVTRRAICRTPIDLAGFNDVNGEELGRALVGKLPGAAAWREGGVEPEVFAAEQGYGSAAAMARDIIDSPTPEERVRQLVDKRQAEHDALFDADEYLFGREQLAEQRERIAEALEAKVQAVTAEQRHRREAAGRTVSGEETIPAPDDCADCGSAARRLAGRDRLRARARAVLDKRPMGEEVMPEQFRRAASRWMREERRAILRGDFGKALQANCRTRINIELARQSAERRGMLRTLEKKAKEFLEMDRADSDARFAVLVLSQNIGLFNPTRGMLADAGGKGWENVEAFAVRMREVGLMGAEDALDRELFTTSRAWKGMKWGEFRPYAETMRMIMHMERESRTAETASGRVALEARAREIADSIHENNTRREPEARAERNEAVELLKKFHAAHLKADTVALLDGDIMGAAWRAIVRPVSDAAGKRAERLRRERDVLRKLFSVYSRRELEDMKGKRFTVPGIPDAITKEQALSVLLNSGSAGNLRRLMAGRNLAEEQIRAIVDTLDERDVRFAQAVWDYFETFGKEISDLEESLTGVRPEAVEARPVQTRFGLLRGGYYPVACDRELSARPVDTDRLGTQTGGMFPSLSRGPLKQRQAVGLGTPLSLSLDVIPRHVAETVHMLTFRRPVTEAAKILRRREVNGAIRETAGVAAAEALDGWLRHVAGERPARGGWDRAASWARKNAALYTMGFRLSAMLARMTGLLSPVAEIGPRWALRGVVDSYGRGCPLDVCRTVMELSPMMRDRIMSTDREVFEVSSRLMEPDSSNRASDPFARMKSFMETRGSVPMGWVRMYFADLPIWNGAYARALKENGGDIAEAVLYADAVVERARAGGAARDLAAVRPGWEPGRLMTMFYSCFSALYNLSARRVAMLDMRRDAAAVYRLATLALPTWFAEPALMGALPGGGPGTRNVGDKTDAEDWIVWGAKEAFFHPAGMVFDMREAASPESCPDSCQDSWQDAFDSAMRFGARAGKALQDGADGRELLSGRETTEQDTGFITARELQLLETFRDWLDGTSPERELGSLIRKKNRQAENE